MRPKVSRVRAFVGKTDAYDEASVKQISGRDERIIGG